MSIQYHPEASPGPHDSDQGTPCSHYLCFGSSYLGVDYGYVSRCMYYLIVLDQVFYPRDWCNTRTCVLWFTLMTDFFFLLCLTSWWCTIGTWYLLSSCATFLEYRLIFFRTSLMSWHYWIICVQHFLTLWKWWRRTGRRLETNYFWAKCESGWNIHILKRRILLKERCNFELVTFLVGWGSI